MRRQYAPLLRVALLTFTLSSPLIASTAFADVVGSPDPCNENGDGTCTCSASLGAQSCCVDDGFTDDGCTTITDGNQPIGYQCTCRVPSLKTTYHPAYRVLTVISALPGNKSQDGFTAGTQWGTQTQVVMNSSVTNVYQVSTNAFSTQGTFSVGSSNGLATTVTDSTGQGFMEPNTNDTFSHLNDHFIIWLNAQMDVWSSSGTIGPFTTQFKVDDNTRTMDLIDVTLAQLINPSLLPSYVAFADEFANLTVDDRNSIIALDPWGSFYQQPANYPCGGDPWCEYAKGQGPYPITCPVGGCRCDTVQCGVLGSSGPVFASTLAPIPEGIDRTQYSPLVLMPPAITIKPVPTPILGTGYGPPPVLLGGGSSGPAQPPKMYLDQIDPDRFKPRGVVQVLGPEYQGSSANGANCSLLPYSEATTTAASQGITTAASEIWSRVVDRPSA